MKVLDIFKKINLLLLTLLSISSGLAKIMRAPEEMKFFGDAGFAIELIVLFGVVQLVGGMLLVLEKKRLWGAVVLLVTFCVSIIIIFLTESIDFTIFSLFPALMALFIIQDRSTNADSENQKIESQ